MPALSLYQTIDASIELELVDEEGGLNAMPGESCQTYPGSQNPEINDAGTFPKA